MPVKLAARAEAPAPFGALLACGDDPVRGGWESVANPLWAAHASVLDTALLRARLPHSPKAWPAQLRQIAGEAVTKRAPQTLLAGLAATVFPREIDLQAFRVLLLLAVDACTPEELLDLGTGDVEFTDGEVRPRQTKNRAACTRHRLHTGVPAIPDGGDDEGRGTVGRAGPVA
ncbi:hypothetical protein HEP87_63915 [Streptomyces sp. S1D4-11]